MFQGEFLMFRNKQTLWLTVFIAVLLWSGFDPKDRLTWVLEAGPAIICLVALGVTRKCFPLTSILYFWILLHCIVLMIGAKYTYAEVPIFDQLATSLGWQRNHYDKLGHFMQG